MCSNDTDSLYWEIKGQIFQDSRGLLTSFPDQINEMNAFIRFFVIHDLPNGASRGGHAHKLAYQGFYMAHGSCTLLITRSQKSVELKIEKRDSFIVVPPLTFVDMTDFATDSVLIVFTTQIYDPNEYIFKGQE